MTSTPDVCFEQDELYYTLNILNKKIMFMMTLLKMYVIFSCLILYQHLVHTFQGFQQYSLITNYYND